MRLLSFKVDGDSHLGVRVGDEVVNLTVAAPKLPREMRQFVAAGAEAFEAARSAMGTVKSEARHLLNKIDYQPVVSTPSKILCLGVNFLEHASEAGLSRPEFPPVFMRGPSTLIAHKHPMIRPAVSEQLDYEGELAVIIGRAARHVSTGEALSYVAGYSVFNDGSVRDYQLRTSQWTLGKNFDGTGGFGPELVTPDELPEGAVGLRLQTRLNGNIMQDSNTSKMIFGVAECIAILSECLTLTPGDVIIMGTCAGVGLLRKPPVFMRPGDLCEVEIERIGVLSNPIAQEQWKPAA